MPKFKLEYKPVVQELHLSEYHGAYATESVLVCVNPTRAFMTEREVLLNEYAERYAVVAKAMKDQAKDAEEKATAYFEWNQNEFIPKANDWFARLWSFSDEKWTADEVQQINDTDPHLLTWLKKRSIEMIEAHAAGAKKA